MRRVRSEGDSWEEFVSEAGSLEDFCLRATPRKSSGPRVTSGESSHPRVTREKSPVRGWLMRRVRSEGDSRGEFGSDAGS